MERTGASGLGLRPAGADPIAAARTDCSKLETTHWLTGAKRTRSEQKSSRWLSARLETQAESLRFEIQFAALRPGRLELERVLT